MIVVSDTSPLNYLVLIGSIEILPQLFDQILLPQAVFDELNHERTPDAVRQWAADIPPWASIQAVTHVDESMMLGKGEREAISLAEQWKAEALLLDDRKACKIAEARGLVVIGTLNVLEVTSQKGLIDLAVAFARLQKTSFHVTPELLQAILDRQDN